MDTKLIADSGATKTEWCLLQKRRVRKFLTQGMSPYFLTTEQMIKLLSKELLPEMKVRKVGRIYFYGTGCANPKNALSVKKALAFHFPESKITVRHDLLGAAHALCGHEKGIACILGTGSNSCYYNGKRIVMNSPGLGFILGDEGSGAYLGKKLIQHYLYNQFDAGLKKKFEKKYKLSPADILENVYKKPFPNRFLAGFARFIAEERRHPLIEEILYSGLEDFFTTHLLRYPKVLQVPVHFTGSVAFGFQDVLQQLCKKFNIRLGKIVQAPMEGLIQFHK
ncbi:MAG: N-acetylglucosamine kinase [Chitinophagaceae bacterium]|nr:N-acetylglucosamine kinase [Chitinophagaceae bacterium]